MTQIIVSIDDKGDNTEFNVNFETVSGESEIEIKMAHTIGSILKTTLQSMSKIFAGEISEN